ncbi:MAG: hypothetical protein WBN52_01040 [Eudoraea sp.]|uniref:hypothetical protein n=2 Tax=Eudoraea sp. TaxID=1979955 RepID=UPI003C740710
MKLSSLVISTLFLIIILANSFKIVGTIGYYGLFTQDFIERFCENKDKPELQCDGKCELSKMLLQQTEEDKTPINLELLKNEIVLFFNTINTTKFLKSSLKNPRLPQYLNLYSFNFEESIINPPRT